MDRNTTILAMNVYKLFTTREMILRQIMTKTRIHTLMIITRVSENFESANNQGMMKQHNGELHIDENIDNEANEAPSTDTSRTKCDEKDDSGFV